MSALTDLFSSMANKIRSKTGTATTYTPPQMVADGIDDVFDAGVASATTPITPSNASPVSMSANTGYKPTAGGYAISSYVSKAPSNSMPPSLTAGDMCRIENNGYAVANITGVTPSDTSPVALSQNDICGINQNGYAIESEPTNIQPSNLSPVSLSSGGIYKPSLSGYAIRGYSSETPSDTSPVLVSSGSIIKPSAAGYLVKTVSKIGEQPDKVYTANSVGTSGTTTITVTQKPRYAFVNCVHADNANYIGLYLFDFTKSKAWYLYKGGSSASFTSQDYSSRISEMFSTVSSSQVVFQNNSFNTTKRLAIALYY